LEKEVPSDVISYDPKCYLCPGNTRNQGQLNENYTTTWVFDNDFPAILDEQQEVSTFEDNLLKAEYVRG